MSVGRWHEESWAVIDTVHKSLPVDATLAQRKKALKDAYPFGQRAYWPYKAWCKARRQYLARYAPPKPLPAHLLVGWQ